MAEEGNHVELHAQMEVPNSTEMQYTLSGEQTSVQTSVKLVKSNAKTTLLEQNRDTVKAKICGPDLAARFKKYI